MRGKAKNNVIEERTSGENGRNFLKNNKTKYRTDFFLKKHWGGYCKNPSFPNRSFNRESEIIILKNVQKEKSFAAPRTALKFRENIGEFFENQIRRGYFIDLIFDRPEDIQELVTDEYMYKILKELNYEYKELIYMAFVKGMSNMEIATCKGRSKKAIWHMKKTVLRKIRKKVYDFLTSEEGKKRCLTTSEKKFIERYENNQLKE